MGADEGVVVDGEVAEAGEMIEGPPPNRVLVETGPPFNACISSPSISLSPICCSAPRLLLIIAARLVDEGKVDGGRLSGAKGPVSVVLELSADDVSVVRPPPRLVGGASSPEDGIC